MRSGIGIQRGICFDTEETAGSRICRCDSSKFCGNTTLEEIGRFAVCGFDTFQLLKGFVLDIF